MFLEVVLLAFSSVVLVVYYVSFKNKVKPISLKGKHVVVSVSNVSKFNGFIKLFYFKNKITGGSLGIGKEIAKEAVKEGAHVTIISRNQVI